MKGGIKLIPPPGPPLPPSSGKTTLEKPIPIRVKGNMRNLDGNNRTYG